MWRLSSILLQKCFGTSSSTSDVSTKGAMAVHSTSAIMTSTSTTASSVTSAPTYEKVSTSSLNESGMPRPSSTVVHYMSSSSASATDASSSAMHSSSPSSSADMATATGSYQRRKARALKGRAAPFTCTSSNVGIAQLLVDELLDSAS